VTETLDSLDAEDIRAATEMPGYEFILNRTLKELDRRRLELETQRDPIAAAELRGMVAALRTVVRIPEILIGEAKSQG
jgi:hypothetical protein